MWDHPAIEMEPTPHALLRARSQCSVYPSFKQHLRCLTSLQDTRFSQVSSMPQDNDKVVTGPHAWEPIQTEHIATLIQAFKVGEFQCRQLQC